MTAEAPTERQLQVLLAWFRLRNYKAVAEQLGIAVQTAKNTLAVFRQQARTDNDGLVKRYFKYLGELDGDPSAYRRIRYELDEDYRERQRRIAREGMKRIRAARADQRKELYQELFEAQKGRCAICGVHESEKVARSGRVRRLAIDHDHATGATRGLLCTACNVMLGNAEDSPERLEKGARYLRSRTSHNVEGTAA